MSAQLVAWLDGRPVALVEDAGQVASITYLPEVVDEHPGEALLSVQLPVRTEPYAAVGPARAFLDGLLPEGWVRQTLARNARLDEADTFGLLARYGGDCAGAVSFLPPGEAPGDGSVRWLSDEELVRAVRDLRALPLGDGTDRSVRLSLGGVQEKLVVVIDDARVGIPIGTRASTHILKPAQLSSDGTELYPGVAQLEHLCLSVAAAAAAGDPDPAGGIGFRVASTELRNLSGRTVLVVARYDRRAVDGVVVRIHQEDGCQALGLGPGQKYQRLDEQLPSLAAFAGVLGEWGAEPLLDRRALLQAVAFTVIAGNADLHAKNLSLLHDGGIRLAPIYDVVPTRAYAQLTADLGLRVGGEYHVDDVTVDHLIDEAAGWGLGRRGARRAVEVIAGAVGDLAVGCGEAIAAEGFDSSMLAQAVALLRDRAACFLGS